MHENVFYNGQIFSAADAFTSSVSPAALYGKGIFTTIAVRNKESFLWKKHWKRLENNARHVRISIADFSDRMLEGALNEIIVKNDFACGRARITFFDESPSDLWLFESYRKTSLLITTTDLRETPQNFRLTVSPHRINSTSPLAGIKSCNYLDKILALDEAKKRGFDEAVCLNEGGEIASAGMANIFWLKDRKLYTPSLKTGCLPGTTREFILENCECEEIEAEIEALKNADSIFLTSAGIGVVQAAEFDGKILNKRTHEILRLLPDRN